MERLTKYNLKLKLSKCSFFKKEIKFVGHMISHNRISPCKSYINKVIKLKRPRKSEIGSFVGFVGWLSKYCFRLKNALEPISRLKKKNVEYQWTEEQERAFILCQQIIDSADILRQPDYTKPFYLWCDASEYAPCRSPQSPGLPPSRTLGLFVLLPLSPSSPVLFLRGGLLY